MPTLDSVFNTPLGRGVKRPEEDGRTNPRPSLQHVGQSSPQVKEASNSQFNYNSCDLAQRLRDAAHQLRRNSALPRPDEFTHDPTARPSAKRCTGT